MTLESYLAGRLCRPAGTPGTPHGASCDPAQTPIKTGLDTRNTWNTATPQDAANDTPDLRALLEEHGDGSAGGVDWTAWAVNSASATDSWLVLTDRGLTMLRLARPITKPGSYFQAWPLERIAPWPEIEDDAEIFSERNCGLGQHTKQRIDA